MASTRIIYIDECGTPDLDVVKSGVQNYFLLTAVIVQSDREPEVRARAEVIRQRHFQTGPIRSSGVGSRIGRRRRVLADLKTLPVKFYCLAIDKRQVVQDGGLIYREPFIKFAHRTLYHFLLGSMVHTSLVAEQYGRPAFMDSFQPYLASKLTDLFPWFDFEFRGKDDVLLGVADFLGGSIARIVDPFFAQEDTSGIWQYIEEQFLGIHEFPPQSIWHVAPAKDDGQHDGSIRRFACDKAIGVAAELAKMRSPTEYEAAQEVVLRYLIFSFTHVDPRAFVFGDRLRQVVRQRIDMRIEKRQFNAEVISKLRDKGVIILSGERGYKLPYSRAELERWLADWDQRISPMIQRIDRAAEAIKLLTVGELDLLAEDRWDHIRSAAERIRQGAAGRALLSRSQDAALGDGTEGAGEGD